MPEILFMGVGINAVSIIRKLRVGLVIGALIFLSPLAASVIVISAEMGVDLVTQAGVAGVLDLGIAGVIGWMVLKDRRRRVEETRRLAPGQVADEEATAPSF
jgi:hypothetical protein